LLKQLEVLVLEMFVCVAEALERAVVLLHLVHQLMVESLIAHEHDHQPIVAAVELAVGGGELMRSLLELALALLEQQLHLVELLRVLAELLVEDAVLHLHQPVECADQAPQQLLEEGRPIDAVDVRQSDKLFQPAD